jgi:branched-chain amino acid aminotransferase
MKITKTEESRLSKTDFENLPFGKIYTDHMLWCEFKNGTWGEPEIKPYQKVMMSPATHAIHYGQAIFEGMKAYRRADGGVSVFRAIDNFKRLNKSAERMMIPQISENTFMDGLMELLRTDAQWVPKGEGMSLYIRPFMYASSEFIAARPSEEYVFCIIMSPSGPYYSGDVKVKIEETFSRSTAGGVGFAKAAGNYGAAFYPTKKAQDQGFTQIVWTDHKNHELIEESGTMNIGFLIDGVFRTPPLSERILAGITRDSVIKLVAQMGIEVKEAPIKVAEVLEAIHNKTLQEAFGMGTAAVISPISGIGYRDEIFEIPAPKEGFAMKIKQKLSNIRMGIEEDTFGWMQKIS